MSLGRHQYKRRDVVWGDVVLASMPDGPLVDIVIVDRRIWGRLDPNMVRAGYRRSMKGYYRLGATEVPNEATNNW